MFETFTHATFAPLVGQVFVAAAIDGETLELHLSECELWRHPSAHIPGGANGRVPFSLLFHVTDHRFLEQQTFTLRHPDLGEFPLFLVPLGPDEQGMRYEAVLS